VKYKLINLLQNDNYIRKCNEQDIDNHYSVVESLVSDSDTNIHKKRMLKCIAENTAYCLIDGSCFLYFKKLSPYKTEGVLFYGKGNPVGTLTLLISIFYGNAYSPVKTLSFIPHKKEGVINLKSLLTVKSIKKWYEFGTPVIINISLIKQKLDKILHNSR